MTKALANRVFVGEESLQLVSRTAQWRIDVSTFPRSTRNFTLGNWNWNLGLICKRNGVCSFLLSALNSMEKTLYADFVLRVAFDNMTWHSCLTRTVEKQCFQSNGNLFEHEIELIGNYLVIEVEFLNMAVSISKDGQLKPQLPAVGVFRVRDATQYPLKCLSRMFMESIHTDVTINTKNGTLSAHKAILAASSPVFACMFDNDFKEKFASTIDIDDMSLESCKAFLSYLYGDIREEDLWTHKVALFEAAHKYGIVYLEKMCEDCMIEDINLSNVIKMLSLAHLYKLKSLKQSCLSYLFDMDKATAIIEDLSTFILDTDPELAKELLKEMLSK